ncbi:ribonuclease H [Tanacetum coccineum]
MQKNLASLKKYFPRVYKPTNNNLRTSSNSRNKTEDTTPRYNNDNQSRQFGNQRTMTVAGAREIVGSQVVQQTGIQCFNCKGYGHYAKECRKPKRVKDYAYHKEKMMMCKQAEQGVPLQAEQADWLGGHGMKSLMNKNFEKHFTATWQDSGCLNLCKNSSSMVSIGKAQSEKPCLYEIPYDTSDHANRFCPNGEETVTLEKESRSKLNKDTVKPYDYTYQNSLYEIFKPPSKTYLDQLERAKEVRKTMWRKTMHRIATSTKQNRDRSCLMLLGITTSPHVSKSTGVIPTSVSKPQLKSYQVKLNPRASAQNKDAKSHKTTKRYMPVEKSSASKKPERQIPTGHRFSNKKTTTVPEKTMNPRSCLRWKPTGRIFSNVRLRWIPTGKLLNSCTGKVDSEPTHVSIVDIPHIHACKQTLGLSAGTSFNGQKQQRIDLNADALYNEKQENLRVWPRSSMFKRRLITADQASVFMAMMSVHISSGLVLHQMTSDHNRSELGIQDHSNEQSSSKLVPKVVP